MTPNQSPHAGHHVPHAITGLAAYASRRGITVVEAARLSEQATRYDAMSPNEQLAFDAQLVANMTGTTYVEALKRLGMQ